MTDIILHKSKQYIKEDIDYYCSDIRDKHGMIKPSDNLVSLTCDSNIFHPNPSNDEICSIYYPFEKGMFHRIYIGISFPLFANNWGAAFLRHLMHLVDKDGAVIMPVYAERQGVEKNYWSRSSLESIFQSRQKWWGMSNIWAENDGVMSMRIGKKQPPKKNSTLTHLLNKNIEKAKGSNSITNDVNDHHQNGTLSAIVEQIILNYYGRSKAVTFCEINGNGLLAIETMMSDYVKISQSTAIINEKYNTNDFKKYLNNGFDKKFKATNSENGNLNLSQNFDVITMINILDNKSDSEKKCYVDDMFNKLNRNGILILQDNGSSNMETFDKITASIIDSSVHSQYSSIVATKLNTNINIPHYSDIIFEELKNENISRNNVINVFQKK
tara:strand:- start:552 stop:1703 length:1152 start_codon:yes stop_codon:yes gene_type:complete